MVSLVAIIPLYVNKPELSLDCDLLQRHLQGGKVPTLTWTCLLPSVIGIPFLVHKLTHNRSDYGPSIHPRKLSLTDTMLPENGKSSESVPLVSGRTGTSFPLARGHPAGLGSCLSLGSIVLKRHGDAEKHFTEAGLQFQRFSPFLSA